MYSSDPKQDTFSLMQLESRRAVPQAKQSPSKASARTINYTTWRQRSEKNTADFGITHILSFFLFSDMKPGSYQIGGIIIANKSLSSAKAAFVCSFRGSGKNRRHLGCRNIMRSRGCAVQNKGITLNRMVCCSQFSNDIYALISL